MLRPRIIPCLLLRNNGLVKTINFKDETYVGDPINVVRIFNEKYVDEIMIIDIDASSRNIHPNFEVIEKIAAESQMPISYTGGIKNLDQARKIIGFGIEKVGISSAAINNPELIEELSEELGNQSVVVILDVKKIKNDYKVFIYNGKENTEKNLSFYIDKFINLGIGEIIINSIDNDGTMKGYDLEILEKLKDKMSIPLTLLGGAGSHEDIAKLFNSFGIIGAGVGSLFVFRGKYKAVLVNYPSEKEKQTILGLDIIK